MQQIISFTRDCFDSLFFSYFLLAPAALFFVLLAFALKGRAAVAAARQAAAELRINLWLHALDNLLMLPIMALLVGAIGALVASWGINAFQQQFWAGMGVYPTLLLVLFLGDFEAYWRHRFEHTRLIWPSHAVHHSDSEMTWLTLERFHPINTITTTVIDSTFLSLMGFPSWAIVANALVRHYYGYFIHADLPWTYGPLSRVFVSPAMHHWHHARDVRYAGTNFATLFSVFDIALGTYKPGICDVPVGLDEDMGVGVKGQLAYPFAVWWGRWSRRGKPGTDPVAEGGATSARAALTEP